MEALSEQALLDRAASAAAKVAADLHCRRDELLNHPALASDEGGRLLAHAIAAAARVQAVLGGPETGNVETGNVEAQKDEAGKSVSHQPL
jgi:hypothetical protein